jgi:hypothetical protein
MSISTVVKISGTAVNMPRPVLLRSAVIFRRGGIPSATFEVRGGKLPGLPDPYTGKTFSIEINTGSGAVRYFTGDVTGYDPDFVDGKGWVRRYNALGLQNRADWFPHTDSNTGLDTSVYNASQDNQPTDFILARSGRTVGQILTAVLTMLANATNCQAYGLANLTIVGSTVTLPTATVTDLAALTLIPQAPVYYGGETFWGAWEGFLAAWAPNHLPWIDPATGNFRISDMRTFTAAELTLGTDPVMPTLLRRDVSNCFQRVVIRGQPIAEAIEFSTINGGLSESPFAHDGLSVAAAKAAWLPADYQNPGQAAGQATCSASITSGAVTGLTPDDLGYGYPASATFAVAFSGGGGAGASGTATTNSSGQVTSYTIGAAGSGYTSPPSVIVPAPGNTNSDTGTLVCTSTTTVTLTSSNPRAAWPSDYWDYSSTGREGTLFLSWSAGTSITTYAQRATVANGALTAGGSCTANLDRALPHLLFDGYRLTGQTKGASDVWRRYALPAWAAAVCVQQSTYPYSLHIASNTAETLTSSAMGLVEWFNPGASLPQQAAVGITVDPSTGTILFSYPTFLTAGAAPYNVSVFVPINTGLNLAIEPPNTGTPAVIPAYAGTSHTQEGLTKTLTITVQDWRDPANTTPMLAYASEVLDSVKDAVIEGDVEFLGLYTAGLTPGLALNIAGSGYNLGWESGAIPALPVTECELSWGKGGILHITTMKCSNRRQRFGAEAFMRPDRSGLTFDWGDATIDTTSGGGGGEGSGAGESYPSGSGSGSDQAASEPGAAAPPSNPEAPGFNQAPDQNPDVNEQGVA